MLTCPHCQERLWVGEMQIPLLTCPRCFGVIVNPNAASKVRQPREVIPLERDVHFDMRDTVGGLGILAIMLIVGGGASIYFGQVALSVILIGFALMVGGFIGFTQRK